MMTASSSIDPDQFRDLMAAVCAPVTVVTAFDRDTPHGATVSSFASLSLAPALITVAFDHRSGVLSRILATGRFGVNLLGHDQSELAALFAQRNTDRFADVGWWRDNELPRLDGAAAWIACELHDVVEGGDHRLLIGRVTVASRTQLPALIYVDRTFGTHSRFEQMAARAV